MEKQEKYEKTVKAITELYNDGLISAHVWGTLCKKAKELKDGKEVKK